MQRRRRRPTRKQVEVAVHVFHPKERLQEKALFTSPNRFAPKGRTGRELHVVSAEVLKIQQAGGEAKAVQVGESTSPLARNLAGTFSTYVILAKKGGQTYQVRNFEEWSRIP